MSHTPGPWVVNCKPTLRAIIQTSGEDADVICEVYKWFGAGKEADANVKLIATAPELLEALELLTDWAEGVVRYGTVKGAALMPLENAKEIIKTARGKK